MANLVANIAENNNEMYTYVRLTASGLIKTGVGQLGGFLVATGTPTITIYDGTSASGTLMLNGVVTTAGVPYPVPCGFNTGLYVAISGTCDVTFFYN